MSLSSQISLGALRLQTIQRSDMENNPSISVAEWNGLISNSYKALYDKLVAAYGNDYYVATPYPFTINGGNFYSLPSDFYKLLGVDLQYSASPSGWVSLKRFEFIDRNKASYFNTAITISAQAQAWYIPEPTSLIFYPTCALVAGSSTIASSDTTNPTAGMTVYGPGIQTGTTILAVNTTLGTITLSKTALATIPINTLQMWSDAVMIDGIAGWEEFIIIDGAIKAGIKQEEPIDDLKDQRNEMVQRIEGMAEGRDAGQAQHVSDAMSINGRMWGLGSVGLANLRYRLTGSQLQFASISDDDCGGDYGYGGGY